MRRGERDDNVDESGVMRGEKDEEAVESID